jgi:hypothetical protein
MPVPTAMTESYSTLLERVGHYLFGIRSSFSADQTTDIENAIQDGLRDVYGAHDWSFFRPLETISTVAPYATGTIQIASGVVTLTGGTFPAWAANGTINVANEYYEVATRDGNTQVTLEDTSVTVAAGSGYELIRLEYDLAAGFESIETRLTYEPGKSNYYPPVMMRDDRFVRELQQDDPFTDRPLYFSIRTTQFDPTAGSLRTLSFWPYPDAVYRITGRMTLRPTMVDATNEFPIGGEILSQLILEACMAAAERLYDESEGVHTKRFQESLPLAILADQKASSPTTLGRDAPRGQQYGNSMYDYDYWARSVRIGNITLDGTDL